MGAAAGKAVEGSASAGTARAEDRLAVAERVVFDLDCRRSSYDGTNVGIWDAQATCTNKGLLAAIDEIVFLKETHAFPTASTAGRRMDGALRAAMSHLMEEVVKLRVWDGSQLEGRSGLRFAVEKLSVSMASRGSSSIAFLIGDSTSTARTGDSISTVRSSTGDFSYSTVDELYASGGSQRGVVTGFKSLDEFDLICPASVSVLHEISKRVIRAGYTKELLQAFDNAPCDVLDRFLTILQMGCFLRTDKVMSYENAEWWTAEDMIRRWILSTKLVEKALVAMQMQLQAQRQGAFDRFKSCYLMAIAKRSTSILLMFADGFTSTHSPDKVIYVLQLYEVLVDSSPGLMLVFTGQHKELMSCQVEGVLARLARALRVMTGGLVNKIRPSVSSAARSSTGVHPLTRNTMAIIESLAPHHGALDVILASTSSGRRRGDADGVSSFGDLVSELIASLEANIREISALHGAEGGGLWHLFHANNTDFVLKHADVLEGDDWTEWRQSRVEQHVTGYVEASWAPVVACLEAAGAGVKILAKFNSALEKVYSGHLCREVTDPALRAELRKAVSDRVVGAYDAYLFKHPKLRNSARYTAESLAELLSDLFEGEAGEGTSNR
ncbi:hypothetical protein ACQJBY_067740 [Aegilops geniculata]